MLIFLRCSWHAFDAFQGTSHNKYHVEEFADTGGFCFSFISIPVWYFVGYGRNLSVGLFTWGLLSDLKKKCCVISNTVYTKHFLLDLTLAIIIGNFQAMYQVCVLLVLNFQGVRILGLEHQNSEHAIKVKNTLIFNAFVICQVSYYLHPFIAAKSFWY